MGNFLNSIGSYSVFDCLRGKFKDCKIFEKICNWWLGEKCSKFVEICSGDYL